MIHIERTIVITDLENACGGSHMVSKSHKAVRRAIDCLLGVSPHFLIYSTGPKAMWECPEIWFTWNGSGARFVQGRGLDGADNALIDVIRNEPVASRSSQLVLVSGDHAFAGPVAELRAKGIRTTVVSRPGSLSKELASQADQICWLPEFAISPVSTISTKNIKGPA